MLEHELQREPLAWLLDQHLLEEMNTEDGYSFPDAGFEIEVLGAYILHSLLNGDVRDERDVPCEHSAKDYA